MNCITCGAPATTGYCVNCAELPFHEVIVRTCVRSTETNPVELADAIMHHPKFPVAGQAHHPLVAAAILASIRNTGRSVANDRIEQAIKRAEQIPAGYCAGFGADAAAIACGIAVAVMEGTTVKAEHAAGRTLAHLLTGQAMLAIAAHSGHRCCKRSVFTVLDVAATFFIGTRGISLSRPDERIQCRHWQANNLCNKRSCRYFPDDVSAEEVRRDGTKRHQLPLIDQG